MKKLADLLPDVKLQPHQEELSSEAEEQPLRKLLVHALGSGKTLTSIAASEANKEPYTAITPAALRANFRGEQKNFTDQSLPSTIMSYNQLARGNSTPHGQSLVFDEAHRLRNPESAQSQQAQLLASKAKQVLMLTGTPIVNDPSDLAVPLSMLRKEQITPEQFTQKFVGQETVQPTWWSRFQGIKPGTREVPKNTDELKALLNGHVDWYDPGKPVVPTKYEDHHVEMGPEQTQLYNSMFGQLPWATRWKLKNDFPLNQDEMEKMTSFMTGPRQVGLSTNTFLRTPNPYKAYQQSPKLQKAVSLMKTQLADQRTRGLVFSNFIDAGLTPYAEALKRENIPHAVFHGGLNDTQRKQLVDDYNANKIRVALLGPSGTEGLSFKGTNLIQLLDPYWNSVRGKQSVGRGLRFGSHDAMPADLQNVTVQRLISRLPMGVQDRILNSVGWHDPKKEYAADDYLSNMAKRKEELNNRFTALLKEVGTRR
jgi:superfamily II DNA or RNA helicase